MSPPMNPLAKDVAAICRMQIELVKANSAVLSPGQPLADVLELHFVLLHLFLADAERRQLSVSELARVMGLSRATVRHKLAKLVKMGQCTNGDEGYALSHDRDMAVLRKLLAHKAKIITAASKEVADLAASNGRATGWADSRWQLAGHLDPAARHPLREPLAHPASRRVFAIKAKPSRRKVPPSLRLDAEILAKREAGKTLRALAAEYGVSRERIHYRERRARRRRENPNA